MTEECKKILSELADPDKQAGAILQLSDILEALYTANDEHTQTIEQYKNTIDSLRDTNAKLVLRVTEPIEQQQEEKEQTPEEALDSLIHEIMEG